MFLVLYKFIRSCSCLVHCEFVKFFPCPALRQYSAVYFLVPEMRNAHAIVLSQVNLVATLKTVKSKFIS